MRALAAGLTVLAAIVFSAGVAAGCAYVNDLAASPADSSRLSEELAVVRAVSDDPLVYREQGVDGYSQTCLACHGGSIFSGWGIRFNHSGGGAGGAHRIGTNYVLLALRGNGLRDPEQLDSRIVLVGGRVGCFSCHDPFNPDGKHLTVANSGSRLCLSCHLK